MISDKVLLQYTVYKGKHKIQDWWKNTVYEVVDQPFENMPIFKIKPQRDDDRVKIVHRNQLLPLLSNPLDHAGEPDNSRSLVDLKETIGAQMAIAVSAIASHIHYLSAYGEVQVTNLIQKGLMFVTTLFWKY